MQSDIQMTSFFFVKRITFVIPMNSFINDITNLYSNGLQRNLLSTIYHI